MAAVFFSDSVDEISVQINNLKHNYQLLRREGIKHLS